MTVQDLRLCPLRGDPGPQPTVDLSLQSKGLDRAKQEKTFAPSCCRTPTACSTRPGMGSRDTCPLATVTEQNPAVLAGACAGPSLASERACIFRQATGCWPSLQELRPTAPRNQLPGGKIHPARIGPEWAAFPSPLSGSPGCGPARPAPSCSAPLTLLSLQPLSGYSADNV